MKRALLTLLLDLSATDLRSVAAAWTVRLTKRTQADNVALIFAAMTDRWLFADIFADLSEASQTLLVALVIQFADGLTRDAFTALTTTTDVASLSDALAPLEATLLAVHGADGTIFVPRELATLVSQVIRERGEAGEGSDNAPSLPYLLAALDVNVLADAARQWGVSDVVGSARPGERERLIAALRQRTTSARTLVEVESMLSEGARRVIAALRDSRETDGALPLDDATARAGIQTREARRALLRELTTSLLVCQVWVEGSRALVMPTIFRAPAAASLPPLVAVTAATRAAWRHPHAFAWDILTLLRLIEREAIVPATGGLAALAENYTLARDLAPQFWMGHDTPTPPAAALAFLLTLAEARGLVESDDDRHFTLHDPVAWAKQEFAAQTHALFATWLALAAWSEGRGTSVALWGVHWPTFRTRLLEALAACGVGQWHTLNNVLDRLVAVRPVLLGEGFTAAGAVGQAQPDRDALTRLCAEATLRTALTWFGIVAWGKATGEQPVLQLTEVGRWLLDRGPEPHVPAPNEAPFSVTADGRIGVRHAEPPQLWPLLAFAEAETLGHVPVYCVTATTLRRALRRGLGVAPITRFLASRAGGEMPEELRARLTEWARSVRRVTLAPAIILTVGDGTIRTELTQVLQAADADVETLPDGRLLVRYPGGIDTLTATLAAADFAPEQPLRETSQ